MKYGVVKDIIGVLKKSPDESSENIDEVLLGMNIEILKKIDDNWFYIVTDYNYKGYMKNNCIIEDDLRAMEWKGRKNKVICHDFCDVLKKDSIYSSIICSVTRGAQVIEHDYDKESKFALIELPDGRKGFIRKCFLKDFVIEPHMEEDILRENIINTAKSYLGTQYRWGGKTPLGIDCSGLCSISYMINGINIYRDADIKDSFPVKEIPLKEIKKADLIFFPGHVVMYLGNDKFIHASTRHDIVRINSFNCKDEDYDQVLAENIIKAGSVFTQK